MRWVADIGNRFTKIGVVRGGAIAARHVLRSDAFDTPDAAGGFPDGPTEPVVFASVNPGAAAAFSRWIERCFGVPAERLGVDRPIPIRNDCEGVGADRLVNAVAAIARFPQGAIAVDVGTAITVDAVHPPRRFLGGAILEGPHLAARALHEHTQKLPLIEPRAPARAIATSTRAALESGVFHGTLGGIAALVRAFRAELDLAAPVALTGGDAPLVAAALSAAVGGVHPIPELTLDGVRLSGTG